MAPSKLSWILLLGGILLLGLPTGVRPETSSDEIKPSSVKECRVHIEKALEQYWEQKEPPKEGDSNVPESDRTPLNINEDSNEEEEPEILESKTHTENDEEETDESDEEPADNEENDEHDETDDDEEEEPANDDVEDEDDDESENTSENEIEENDDEEDETNEEETEDEEEGKTIDDQNDNETEESENEDSEENDTNETEESDEHLKTDSNQESNLRKDDDEATGESSSLENEEEEEEEEEESSQNEEHGEEKEEDDEEHQEEKDKQQEEEDEHQEEEDEQQEEEEIDDINEADDELKEGALTNTASESTADESEVSTDRLAESQEVTGETDSASTGVAPELPTEEHPFKRTEAAQAAEETSNVTVPEEETQNISTDEAENQTIESGTENIDDVEDKDDDTIENIYEEDEDDDSTATMTYRSRDHVDAILGLDEIGTEYEKEEEKLAQSIFRDIKKIEQTMIKPMEMLFKYADSTSRSLGDAEIFSKPMLLFLGPWNAGKTTIINYLLGVERTPSALKTGTGITDVDFSLITYGDQRRTVSGTELVADWHYAGLQKFGQGFLDHLRSIHLPHTLLKKVTIVDTPGILENRKSTERGYSLNDAFQWFIDRADAIYVVLDPSKVDIGGELGSVIDQLKGRDVRFILNKADTIRRSDLMRVVGQLFWNLSPLMSSTEAPVIYAVSLTTKPYHPSAPVKFLADQEKNFLYDMKDTLDKRVENRILYARRHAVKVRNHANMVDCYLATYYRHKSIFSSKKNVAKLITENPLEYNIFEGLSSMTNVSRYDLPNPATYKEFFKLHPLYDFKPLASTCSYFRGCPMDKLDAAIAKEIPELFAKYKKAKNSFDAPKQEGR
ncbi:sarcalumenin-like [Uloborus diversus]|uniref:sarcalumenin-like n=1 Tax=Uloborus diversus TaxID=327109 RepID=UPI00240A12DC|nr:sarcalumenin-like [Uloborus diversus]